MQRLLKVYCYNKYIMTLQLLLQEKTSSRDVMEIQHQRRIQLPFRVLLIFLSFHLRCCNLLTSTSSRCRDNQTFWRLQHRLYRGFD